MMILAENHYTLMVFNSITCHSFQFNTLVALLNVTWFNSLFLYKRLYRCYTQLNGFAFDQGNFERKTDIQPDEFLQQYDAQKPVSHSFNSKSYLNLYFYII